MAFFRVMLPETIEEKKLKLPVKFGRLHGGKLAEKARLSLPNGRFWDVGIVKGSEEGVFCFDDEWSRFVDQNSVLKYWVLAFEYAGSSSFNVRIFDLTTCEIDYPSGGSDNDTKEEEDSSIQILDSPPNPHPNSQFAAAEDIEDDDDDDESVQILGSSQPIKKKNNDATTTSSGSDDDDDDEEEEEPGKMLVKELKKKRISINTRISHKLPKLSVKIQRAVKEAMAMKLRNVPSFLVVIQQHNTNPHRLFVPLDFVREHMTNTRSVRLREGKFAEWDVEFTFCDKGLYLFGEEFGKFYSDNGLELGDVCLFEMTREVNVVLRVSICRAGG